MTTPTPSLPDLIRPFRVAISESEIVDLKQRLARTRWPDPETVPDWSQGVRVENAKSLVTYWEQSSWLVRTPLSSGSWPGCLRLPPPPGIQKLRHSVLRRVSRCHRE